MNDPRDEIIAQLIEALEAVEFIPSDWDDGTVDCLWCNENSMAHGRTPTHAPDCQRQRALELARTVRS